MKIKIRQGDGYIEREVEQPNTTTVGKLLDEFVGETNESLQRQAVIRAKFQTAFDKAFDQQYNAKLKESPSAYLYDFQKEMRRQPVVVVTDI